MHGYQDYKDFLKSMRPIAKGLHYDITREIIGCSFEIINELGSGFLEAVYEKALTMLLTERGLTVKCQHAIPVYFRGIMIGDYYADLFVEDKVIVELKAIRALNGEHEAQLINYLTGTDTEVGLLINFGRPTLEYKRLTRSNHRALEAAE